MNAELKITTKNSGGPSIWLLVTGVGLSSKILPKIVAAHPYCSLVTAAAQLGAAKSKMST